MTAKKKKSFVMPTVILIHYKNKRGIYDFSISTIDDVEKIKQELIKNGNTEVTTPLLDFLRNEGE